MTKTTKLYDHIHRFLYHGLALNSLNDRAKSAVYAIKRYRRHRDDIINLMDEASAQEVNQTLALLTNDDQEVQRTYYQALPTIMNDMEALDDYERLERYYRALDGKLENEPNLEELCRRTSDDINHGNLPSSKSKSTEPEYQSFMKIINEPDSFTKGVNGYLQANGIKETFIGIIESILIYRYKMTAMMSDDIRVMKYLNHDNNDTLLGLFVIHIGKRLDINKNVSFTTIARVYIHNRISLINEEAKA